MQYYQQNLLHIAEPQKPADREEATGMDVTSYEALFLAELLREYAHYGTADVAYHDIAIGYVEYIEDRLVRGTDIQRHITLYAHTNTARNVLDEALLYADESSINVYEDMHESLAYKVGEL